MKKMLAFLLTLSMLLTLSACGKADGGQLEETPARVVSQGLFVLDSSLDLSEEEGLSDRETYLIHVYDIVPDETQNSEMSFAPFNYTITLNGVNTYKTITLRGGGSMLGAAITSFVRATRYTVDQDLGTIYGGDSPIRAISVFRVNRNDIKEGATAEFTISGSDLHNSTLSFQGAEIQTISAFDDVFALEEDAQSYQLAASMYARAKAVKNAFLYFQRNGGVENEVTMMVTTVSLLSASNGELSAALTPDGGQRFLQQNAEGGAAEIDRAAAAAAVEKFFPEIADQAKVILEQGPVWVEQASLCADSATWTEENQLAAYNTSIALSNAADAIIGFFEG